MTNFVFERLKEEDGLGEVSPDSPTKQAVTPHSRRAVSGYARAEVPVVRATLPGEELLGGRRTVGISPKEQKLADSNGASTSVLDPSAGEGEGEGGTQAAPFQTGASSSTKPRDLSMFTRRFHLKKTASTIPSRGPASGIQKRKKGQRPDIAVFMEKAREPKSQDGHLSVGHRGADSQPSLKVRSDGRPVVQPIRAPPRKRPGTGTRAVVSKKGAEQGDLTPDLTGLSETLPSMDIEPTQRDPSASQLAEELQRSTLQPSALQQALASATNLDVSQPGPEPRVKPNARAPDPRRDSDPDSGSERQHSPRSGSPLDRSLAALSPKPKSKVPPVDFKNPYPYGPETVPSKDAAEQSDEDEDDYVYDTYIRQPTQPGSAGAAGLESLRLAASGEYVENRKIGIIVITQEDEQLWETYGVDEGKDEDWDSEDEDENGKMRYLYACLV